MLPKLDQQMRFLEFQVAYIIVGKMLYVLLSKESGRWGEKKKNKERKSSGSESVFLRKDIWDKVVNHVLQIQ